MCWQENLPGFESLADPAMEVMAEFDFLGISESGEGAGEAKSAEDDFGSARNFSFV